MWVYNIILFGGVTCSFLFVSFPPHLCKNIYSILIIARHCSRAREMMMNNNAEALFFWTLCQISLIQSNFRQQIGGSRISIGREFGSLKLEEI